MAPNRLNRNISILDVIAKAPKRQREAIINTATRDQISCICDCCNNILNNNIQISTEELKKLKFYKELLRYLAEIQKDTETSNKRNNI